MSQNNANSENSRKIAAKISAGYVKIYNFEMFTKWYNILTKNMPILCGIYQILALSAEYRLFFCSSNWHFEYLPYNSNWYFEKQLFLSELSIYYNRNHILSSKSVIFYTFFFDKVWNSGRMSFVYDKISIFAPNEKGINWRAYAYGGIWSCL